MGVTVSSKIELTALSEGELVSERLHTSGSGRGYPNSPSPGAEMNNTFIRTAFYAWLFSVGSAIALEAQSSPGVSVAVGAMQYNAAATGAVPMIALRAGLPLGTSWLLGEGNLTFASLREPGLAIGTRASVAEGQLQVQLPLYRVRPYLGVGAGWFHYFNSSVRRAETSPTYSAAAGLRVGLSPRFGASAELRLRGWDLHQGEAGPLFLRSAAEWTAGWTYSL